MKTKIEKILKEYLEATYLQDFKKIYELLDKDEIIDYKKTMTEFAEKMDIFGETDDLLKKFKIKDVKILKKMSPKEFVVNLFKMITHEIGNLELQKMIEGTRIIQIEEAGLIANVKYEFPFKSHMGGWEMIQSEVNMLLSKNNWRILFKPGFRNALQPFQKEIDLYYQRKAKDDISKLRYKDDIRKYILVGYKNDDGETILEARFKDAGEFSEGYAYIKIINKYGYINTKGKITIKPQYLKARDFKQRLAAVQVNEKGHLWGFINKKGVFIIPPQFENVSFFSSGLCAVEKDDKWGYIDKEGKTVIPFKFEDAEEFYYGEASVMIRNSEGKLTHGTINKKGEIIW